MAKLSFYQQLSQNLAEYSDLVIKAIIILAIIIYNYIDKYLVIIFIINVKNLLINNFVESEIYFPRISYI